MSTADREANASPTEREMTACGAESRRLPTAHLKWTERQSSERYLCKYFFQHLNIIWHIYEEQSPWLGRYAKQSSLVVKYIKYIHR